MNPFRNAICFFEALKSNREETIRLLMERRIEEWYDDSRQTIIGMLTKWALDGLRLGDDEVLLGLAEGLFDDEDDPPDPPDSW